MGLNAMKRYTTTAAGTSGSRLVLAIRSLPNQALIRRWRCSRRRGRNGPRRCRADARFPRPLRARSRPLRRLPGPEGRTWSRADAFEDRAQSARTGLALDRPAGDRAKRLVGEGELDILHFEQPLVLLDQRVLRIGQDLLQ